MIKVQTSFCGKILFVRLEETMEKIFHIHASRERKKCLFQRKERTNQSILKVDFSNAINKINCKKEKNGF